MSSTTISSNKQNDYLNHHLNGLINGFQAILDAATPQANGPTPSNDDDNPDPIPKDKYRLAQEQQLLNNAAANMVRSAQSLLTLTSDLKQSLLLSDFQTLNETIRSRSLTLRYHEEKNMNVLFEFRRELDDVIGDMEGALGGVSA
ncbi:hypothetical protein HK097_008310 [Rhizophlyctis rosea]|uniref:Mediator of RNA polymerase II transcription subunit 22 n=1 Tax=Rhizophlyctis rosea TaxID=64517 RepID=A0AAD5X149_9FUNG|nr:hypothetical protein HK097_008310 [Rhizophlyctis rosea]